LRLLPTLENFISHISASYDRLDILINNAAQTIRRPPIFYKHLIPIENLILPPKLQNLFQNFGNIPPKLQHFGQELLERRREGVRGEVEKEGGIVEVEKDETEVLHEKSLGMVLDMKAVKDQTPAELTQIPLIPGDETDDLTVFPPNTYDADAQQVDLRKNNTWILKIDQVSTIELAEIHIVNAMAPFVLASKLKQLMAKSNPSYIINVSSMEGKFSRTKTTNHPHTNMAKAAMNMMTRTSARDFAQDSVFMNSVDTGWVTYENPCEIDAIKQTLGLEPPIDEIDGAARILDPVFYGINSGHNQWGLFFKDFLPTCW